MEIGETLYVSTRDQWRRWLAANYQSKEEIWLIYYRKETGQDSLPYNVAVEEALCFGWIDSIRKKIDDERYTQRFTPRDPASGYSQTNKERLARLAAAGKVVPELHEVVAENRPEAYTIPADILAALQADAAAWAFFNATPPAYRRIRAAYVDSARQRPEIFEKRLNHLIEKCAQQKKFGYFIDDFYK